MKIPRFNAFSRNVNTINLKTFSHTWWNIKIRAASTRKFTTLRSSERNMKGCILEANLEG